jgi:hypothetical protein
VCECECVMVVYLKLWCVMVVNLSTVFLGSNSSNSVSSVSQKMNITREVSCQRLPTVWGDLPRPQYVHSICAYGPHHYHMGRPILLPHHLALHVEQTGVIYLPSTAEAGDSQPLDSSNFEGFEVVFSPIVSNTGKHPWKNDVPEWIEPWMECLMETYSLEAWNLMGFSRGAAWGLDIRSRIKAFGLVLLVGPYFLPRRTDEEKQKIAEGIVDPWKSSRNALMCAYGDSDPWKPDPSVMDVMHQFRTARFIDCGHDDSKQRAIDTFWGCLAQV